MQSSPKGVTPSEPSTFNLDCNDEKMEIDSLRNPLSIDNYNFGEELSIILTSSDGSSKNKNLGKCKVMVEPLEEIF